MYEVGWRTRANWKGLVTYYDLKNKKLKMSEIFNGDWWSVRLPTGWHALAEEHGASFCRTPTVGTLHLSATRKRGPEVSDDDLKEFAAFRRKYTEDWQKAFPQVPTIKYEVEHTE